MRETPRAIYATDRKGSETTRRLRIQAFGLPGWYLEQYVATSRYAASLYRSDLLVILIDSGDVTDSVRENGVLSPNLWQITSAGGHFDEVAPTPTPPASRKARLARLSAVFRYLLLNAKLVLPRMQNAAIPEPAAGAGTAGGGTAAPPGSADAWPELLSAADYMLGRLRAEHPGTPILFVSHGDRYLPVEALSTTPLFPDALAVQAACNGRPQFYFLDLRPAFSRDWAAHQRRFGAADGWHWNTYANRLVAETLAAFIEENHLLVEPPTSVPPPKPSPASP